METVWDKIKNIYVEKFGIPEIVVDYIAIENIVLSCVSGLSNSTIARQVNQPKEYIDEVLDEFFGSDGWEEDLDINPYFIYKNSPRTFLGFKLAIENISMLVDSNKMGKAYYLCKEFERIRKEIEKYYG